MRAEPGKLLIGGRWIDAKSGKTFAVYNPTDGTEIAQVAEAGREDVDLAVAAAGKAFDAGSWSRMPASERARLLWKLADAIEAQSTTFGLVETLDNGKPLRSR